MKIEDIIQMVQDINKVAFTEEERKKLEKKFIKNFNNEYEIIEKYRGLWKIEESFKVMKSDLEGRPVHVRRNDRVEGHFLICFLALLFSRILELKLDHKHSVRRIQKSLKNATCRVISKGVYSLKMQDDVFHDIESVFGVSLDQDYARIEQLRGYKKEIIKKHNKN